MSRHSVDLRGRADACRELADNIRDVDPQVELRKMADNVVMGAAEIESKV
jgi:hypothetical protein